MTADATGTSTVDPPGPLLATRPAPHPGDGLRRAPDQRVRRGRAAGRSATRSPPGVGGTGAGRVAHPRHARAAPSGCARSSTRLPIARGQRRRRTPPSSPAPCTPADTTGTWRCCSARPLRWPSDGGFDGTVRLLFQPAEEPGRGAQAMVDAGLLERFPVDAVYGIHNMPGRPSRPPPHPRRSRHGQRGQLHHPPHRPRRSRRPRHTSSSTPSSSEPRSWSPSSTVVSPQRRPDPHGRPVLHRPDHGRSPQRHPQPRHDHRRHPQLRPRRAGSCSSAGSARSASGIAAAHGASAEVTYTHEFAPTVNDAACVATAGRARPPPSAADRVDARSGPDHGE